MSTIRNVQFETLEPTALKPSEGRVQSSISASVTLPEKPAMFSKLSTEEGKVLKDLLAKAGFQLSKTDDTNASDSDLLTGLFEGTSGEEGFEYVPMSDGSKRRLAEAEPAFEGYGKTDVKKVNNPTSGASSGCVKGLPPGVVDVETWGHTLMEKGKFGYRQLSYEEMRTCAELPVSSYVDWLTQHLNDGMNAQFHDFVAYVKMKNAELANSSGGSMIPGSNQPRKFK